MQDTIKIYAVVGPTASGKSALALALAEKYGGEIVSCDSMQIYKRMNIGTAKPTKEELLRVPHHMIDICEPTESFSCADFVSVADKKIRDISARGKLPILCGGTGLYLDSLLRSEDFSEGITDNTLRAELLEFARENGAQALHERLAKVDAESAEQIHPNNIKRVARALEIYYLGGVKKSELDKRSKESGRRFDIRCVCLSYSNREALYNRINNRVDDMIKAGLERETRELLREGVFKSNTTAAQAIGYKELFDYIDGKESLQEAVERLKTATRRYAKRQITWFSSKDYISMTDVCDGHCKKTFEDIVNIASEVFFC